MPLLTTFLKDQLDKPVEDSKKWRMTMIGLKGIAGFFVVGALLLMFQPMIAAHVATLVQFALTAWGGIVGLYLGAQGSVDFKTTSALQDIQKTETREEHVVREDRLVVEGEPGSPDKRPFGGHAVGDDPDPEATKW